MLKFDDPKRIQLTHLGACYARSGIECAPRQYVLLKSSDHARTCTTEKDVIEFVARVSLAGGDVGALRDALLSGAITQQVPAWVPDPPKATVPTPRPVATFTPAPSTAARPAAVPVPPQAVAPLAKPASAAHSAPQAAVKLSHRLSLVPLSELGKSWATEGVPTPWGSDGCYRLMIRGRHDRTADPAEAYVSDLDNFLAGVLSRGGDTAPLRAALEAGEATLNGPVFVRGMI